MYIRMKTGRNIGRAVDMRNEEALAMLADGRAIPVNFDDPNALETKVDFDLRDQQAQLAPELQVSSGAATEPEVVASGGNVARMTGRSKRGGR